MSTAKNIQAFPIKPSVFITVFRSWSKAKFKISRMLPGTICCGDAVSTEFSNEGLSYPDHQMIGNLESDLIEKRLQKFFQEIGYEYEQPSAKEALIKYLNSQGYPTDSEKTSNLGVNTVWIIIPKPYKQPKGTTFTNMFEVYTPEFIRGKEDKLELTVYMTPITKDVKEIMFRVDVPDYIYNKCMEDPDVSKRPTKKYIESNTLQYLHSRMDEYSIHAFNIEERNRSSEKYTKKIAIIFSSTETAQRDGFNHSYMGQSINTKFQWYSLYEYTDTWGKRGYFTYKKKHSVNHSGIASMPSIDAVVDYEKQGMKSHFHTTPPGIMIDWTQEREDFLVALEENFRKLSKNLNDFLSDLNTEKLDRLIATSALKLLGTNNQ